MSTRAAKAVSWPSWYARRGRRRGATRAGVSMRASDVRPLCRILVAVVPEFPARAADDGRPGILPASILDER